MGEGPYSSGGTNCRREVGEEGGVEKFALGQIGFAGGDEIERGEPGCGNRWGDRVAGTRGEGEGTGFIRKFG